MRNLTEENVTDAVTMSLEKTSDPRLRQVMGSLVKHLHGFFREVEPTEAEWMQGIQFLTRVGQMCDDERQEFILLSDVLGVSILMDAMNNRVSAGATVSTVLGPFHRDGAPFMDNGASISGQTAGEAVLVKGRVTDPSGQPIAGAALDVWQTAPNGLYDVQDPEQPPFNLRGRFRTDADGRYYFRTVKPVSYPIPADGPVGQMLEALGRHPYRPAHIHFIVTAEGYRNVVTQLFTEGDSYLDSDAVFGVKGPLVVEYRPGDAAEGARYGIASPFLVVEYDFGLDPRA